MCVRKRRGGGGGEEKRRGGEQEVLIMFKTETHCHENFDAEKKRGKKRTCLIHGDLEPAVNDSETPRLWIWAQQ